MTTSAAIATLTAAFDATRACGGPTAAATGASAPPGLGPVSADPAAVASWPAVPVEVIRAAGLRPTFIRGGGEPTPAADRHLEPDVFPERLHQLVEAAVTGRLADAACIVLPRGSDADYKCFLYLRELVRRGVVRSLPPVLLFDLLQSHGAEVRAYNAGRVRALFETLAGLTGRRPSLDAVREQIASTNAARAARRRLVALRNDTPRLRGTEALPLLGAFWQMPPEEYAPAALEAAVALASRPALEGPRVLLAGAPTDDLALHAVIERHGAIIVAETSPWGGGTAGPDVDGDAEPMTALADAYRLDPIGPRLPVDVVQRRLASALDVDAVVVWLSASDTVFGWDYPALRTVLAARAIPHVVLRGDPRETAAAVRSSLASLLTMAPRREVRHA